MKHLSREKMSEIDLMMPERYGISPLRMMENAGNHVAELVRDRYSEQETVNVFVGKGNNGGDALSAARRIHNYGFDVHVIVSILELSGLPDEELFIVRAMGIKVSEYERTMELDADVAVDGLFGYNLEGEPRPPYDHVIESINKHKDIVSIDIPSGLEVGEGTADTCVIPDCTVTLGMPKESMNSENSGDIYLADISVPRQVYEDLGIDTPFRESSLVRLD
ncbi:MAG: NAD(P)H-hydrate epimerase [Candidatus Nanohaloarchaea archaeon]